VGVGRNENRVKEGPKRPFELLSLEIGEKRRASENDSLQVVCFFFCSVVLLGAE